MAGEITLSQANGLAKIIYGNGPITLFPSETYLLKDLKFQAGQMLGDSFQEMVVLSRSGGITAGGSTSAAYALNTPVPLASAPAIVKGYEFTHRQLISIGMLSRAASGGSKAFTSALSLVMNEMMKTFAYYLELNYLDGTRGIGIAASSTNTNSTTTVVTIKDSEWSAAIWGGAEAKVLQFYTANTTLVSSAADALFTISSVDIANKKITVTGTSTGISALDTAISGNANNVYIYFQGFFGNVPKSVYDIISNTGSLFSIDAASYSMWKGNTVSAGSAALTFGKLQSFVGDIFARTGYVGDINVYLHPRSFANIASDQAALRIYDEANGEFVNGAKSLKFWAQNGSLTVVSHPYMKQGYAYVMADPTDTKIWRRVGSTDITNKLQGTPGDIFDKAADTNAWETRLYTDQAPFCAQPALNGLITGIVPA